MTRLRCSSCTWTAEVPDAPTRFATTIGRFIVSAGHVLEMALFENRGREHRVSVEPDPVTVTLTIDSTQFVIAMGAAQKAGQQLAEDFERIRWQNTIRSERAEAKRWFRSYMTAVYVDLGWTWPGPPSGSPWSTQQQVRVSLLRNVADLNAPTLAELEDARPIGEFVTDVRPTRRNR